MERVIVRVRVGVRVGVTSHSFWQHQILKYKRFNKKRESGRISGQQCFSILDIVSFAQLAVFVLFIMYE